MGFITQSSLSFMAKQEIQYKLSDHVEMAALDVCLHHCGWKGHTQRKQQHIRWLVTK